MSAAAQTGLVRRRSSPRLAFCVTHRLPALAYFFPMQIQSYLREVSPPHAASVSSEGLPLEAAAATWLRRYPQLPLPGRGRTVERWQLLADIAAQDVCLAKLLEAHYDAQAILADLDHCSAEPSALWSVWAAQSADARVVYQNGRLSGTQAWCSGAFQVTHSLVSAQHGANRCLVAVALDQPGIRIDGSRWQAIGMQRIETARVDFDNCQAQRIGADGSYLARPGFWHGGAGIAACWFGAACAVATTLRQAPRIARDPHAAAHLGVVDATLAAAGALLRQLAARIDAHPTSAHVREVLQVRSVVEAAAREVVDRVGRALGAGPLCNDREHAQRCADLLTFIRQHHGERDWQALGERCHQEDLPWRI